jgi:hypothetical protein
MEIGWYILDCPTKEKGESYDIGNDSSAYVQEK